MSHYDFSDELIRSLVADNHHPTEMVITSSEGTHIADIQCIKDRESWPCTAISEYRQWLADHPQTEPMVEEPAP